MARIKSFDQLPLITPTADWRAPTALPDLRGVKQLAFDVETCDPQLKELGPGVRRGGYIVGMSLGTDDGRRWYLPVRHEGGGNLDPDMVWRWARSELNAFQGDLVGANLLYDLDFSAEMGVTFPNVRRFLDIQIAEPLLDEHRLSYSLETLAGEYLKETKREQLLREAAIAYGFGSSAGDVKGNLWRLPAKYVGAYGEADSDLPLRILPLQIEKLKQQGLLELFDLESRLIPALLAMRRRGVRVDVERATEIREKLVVRRDEALAKLRHFAGPKAELMAPESFAAALSQQGLTFPVTAKTRKPSIAKAWLTANAGHPIVDAIIQGRSVNTIINTFIDGHVLTHAINGRIHCEFNQLKSDDGGTIARLSSSNPNLQNLPARDDELGPMIRSLFLPEEGEEWGSCDLSQIEFRLLTHYAIGDRAEEARNRYQNDPKTDFHSMCAGMLGQDASSKGSRGKVKSVSFCRIYGGGIPKIAQTAGISLEEATTFVAKYDQELPFIKKTSDLATKRAAERGYITTIFGRRQRFPLWEPPGNYARIHPTLPHAEALERYGPRIVRAFTYAALNRVLQGSAADQIKRAMVLIHESGVTDVLGPVLISVHDELNSSIPKTTAGQEAIMELKRLMEIAIPLKVPVIAELKIAETWGACK